MTQKQCIYKVSDGIREQKPEAYRPQMVIIGLRNRCKYIRMEKYKTMYLESFTKRVGAKTIDKIKMTIQAEEANIRGSYQDQTDWVPNESFVQHILKDLIFIMEFMIKIQLYPKTSHDSLVDNRNDTEKVKEDLVLLENQLPFFIFEQLFGSVLETLDVQETVEQFIINFFSLKITKSRKFEHFTDMFRCAYEASLDNMTDLSGASILQMESADSLSRAGVNFKETDDYYSLQVAFNRGCLVMPSFHASEGTDKILRNVIAYEQRHAGLTPFTSNYIHFLNFLITNERDVQVLTEEGVIINIMGSPKLVLNMVTNLNRGLNVSNTSQYHNIAMNLGAHYRSRRKRWWATLKKVYFSDLWKGTATAAGILLLFLTLVGTVASVIQKLTKASQALRILHLL
ncbi:unnamed protein product [Cochlearia groenlandica]